jgi:hypothetical protein
VGCGLWVVGRGAWGVGRGAWGVRVKFIHREKFRFLGPNQMEVVVSIYPSGVEQAIIAEYKLDDLIIIERMPTIFKDLNDEWREIDKNIYLRDLLRGLHAEPVTSLTHAKAFEREIIIAIDHVQSYFNQGTARVSTMGAHPNRVRDLDSQFDPRERAPTMAGEFVVGGDSPAVFD